MWVRLSILQNNGTWSPDSPCLVASRGVADGSVRTLTNLNGSPSIPTLVYTKNGHAHSEIADPIAAGPFTCQWNAAGRRILSCHP